MSLVDDILRALSVLSANLPNVNTQDLLPCHQSELRSAFYSLERILSSPPLSPTNRSESTSSVASPLQSLDTSTMSDNKVCISTSEIRGQADNVEALNIQNSTSADRTMAPSNQDGSERPLAQPLSGKTNLVSSFMKRLQKSAKKIRTFVAKDVEAAISRRTNWTQLDPRLVDIDLAERHTTETGKFRAWLGRYSLAEDYLAWAKDTYQRPRDAFLVFDEKTADQKGQGHIAKYVSSIGLPKEKAHKAIRYGLKYISFEHIYGNSGVSVFLCHMFTAFRDLPYSQFNALAKVIRELAEWSKLAAEKSDWISRCRSIYNEDNGQYPSQSLSRKRPLELEWTNEQSRHKRVETANSAATDGDLCLNNTSSNLRPPPDFDPPQPADDLDGEHRLSTDDLLRPNFDLWEDLNIFQSLDLWQEDFSPVQDHMFLLSQATEGIESVGYIPSEQINARLDTFNASLANDCRQNTSRVSTTVNLPLFSTPTTQTVR